MDQHSNAKYNMPLKAPPKLMCTNLCAQKYSIRGVSQDKQSTWLHLMLCLSPDMASLTFPFSIMASHH